MASLNFSAVAVVLLFGLLTLGTTAGHGETVCTVMCVQGVYMTCQNYKGNLTKCSCHCKPQNGHGCAVYSANGTVLEKC